MFSDLLYDPIDESGAAIYLVRLAATASVGRIDCFSTLCRVAGRSSLIALAGRCASTQLVEDGAGGAVTGLTYLAQRVAQALQVMDGTSFSAL